MVATSGFFALTAIAIESWWPRGLLIFMCLVGAPLGSALLWLSLKNLRSKRVVLAEDYVELPDRWNDRPTVVRFDEIEELAEIDTYARVLEIHTSRDSHLLEENWMGAKRYDEVASVIKKKAMEADSVHTGTRRMPSA